MRKVLRKFQEKIMEVTFAEDGEWGTARKKTPLTELSQEPSLLSRIFMAITFAESGHRNDPIRSIEPAEYRNRGFDSAIAKDLGLPGVQMIYGTVSL